MANRRAIVAGTTALIDEISAAGDALEVTAGGLVSSGSDNLLLGAGGSYVEVDATKTFDAASIDRKAAGTIDVGGTNATAVTLGRTGITTTVNGKLSASTMSFGSEYSNGSQSSNWTLDWNNGQKQSVTLTGSGTVTLTAPAGATNLLLRVIQGGVGGFAITWPASVKWPGGSAPTLSPSTGDIDVVSFYYDGTNYYAVASLDFS